MKRIIFLLFIAGYANALPPHIERAIELNEWLHKAISYVKSPYEVKTPADTFRTGGDCADMSRVLIMFLQAEDIIANMYVMTLLKPGQNFIEPDDDTHAVVIIDNWYFFDPANGTFYKGAYPRPHIVAFVMDGYQVLSRWK